MQIILRGPAAGYEAEHTARLFFPDAEKAENLPQDSDFVLAQSHLCTDTILLRLHGRLYWKIALRPQGADVSFPRGSASQPPTIAALLRKRSAAPPRGPRAICQRGQCRARRRELQEWSDQSPSHWGPRRAQRGGEWNHVPP